MCDYHRHHHHYPEPSQVHHHQLYGCWPQQTPQLLPPPPPPPPLPHAYCQQRCHDHFVDVVFSSSRQMRNQAEKLRRDKLNQFINELAALVPMVSSSAKRLDKTSILRLSAAFLRIHQILVNGKDYSNIMAYDPSPLNWCQCVLEGMDGVLLIVTAPGKIVFVSHNVENLIGHQQVELLGQSLYSITKIEDHDELRKNLKPDKEDECEEVGTSGSVESVRNVGSCPPSRRPQRRSFYIRLRQRSVSRSEQPQFETVHVVGQLRVPPPPSPRKHKTEAQLNNDIVLVAMVKPVRDKYVSEYSLLEANKEEWTTRHLVDGRIIFTDHRISITSGYLSEEVTGTYAFRYMHKDDVRWVMVALRQMYFKGESYGTSCYRLLSKNGEFIYVRTVGYLELTGDPNVVQSFICINTLVSKEEGEKCISEMKKQFSPLVGLEAGMNAIADSQVSNEPTPNDDVEDPYRLKEAIEHLIQALPEPNSVESPTGEESSSSLLSASPNPEKMAKCAAIYKSMPPITTKSVDFPVPTLRRNSSASKYDRPSVLRVTQSNTNTVSVVVPAASVVVRPQDKQKRTSDGTGTVLKRPRPEECSVIVSDSSWGATSEGGGVIKQRPTSIVFPPLDDDDFGCAPAPPIASPVDTDLLEARSQDYFPNCLNLPNLDDIGQEDINHLYSQGKDIWETEEGKLEQELVRGQMELKGNIQYQERQISAIKNDLTRVPISAVGGHKYRNTFSHLKAEHRKQQQMLRTLQQDHQNIQHCKDHLTMRGAHQDIDISGGDIELETRNWNSTPDILLLKK